MIIVSCEQQLPHRNLDVVLENRKKDSPTTFDLLQSTIHHSAARRLRCAPALIDDSLGISCV